MEYHDIPYVSTIANNHFIGEIDKLGDRNIISVAGLVNRFDKNCIWQI